MFKKLKMLLMFLMMSSVSKILSETIPIDIYTSSHLINLMSPFYTLLFWSLSTGIDRFQENRLNLKHSLIYLNFKYKAMRDHNIKILRKCHNSQTRN